MTDFLQRLSILLNELELSDVQCRAAVSEVNDVAMAETPPRTETVSHTPDSAGASVQRSLREEDSDPQVDCEKEDLGRATAYDKWKRKMRSRENYVDEYESIAKDVANLKLDRPATELSPSLKSLGCLAPVDILFCPIIAVSKYPYKYVHGKLSELIAEKFFAAGKFWERTWDIYYTWPPDAISYKALLLVPAFQVERLLAEINAAFKNAFLTLNSDSEDIGLTIRFTDHPDLMPRYLGESRSRTEFDLLEERVPAASYKPTGEKSVGLIPSTIQLEQWKRKMEATFAQTRTTKKNKRAAMEVGRRQKKQKWRSDLKLTETMLGFRPSELPKLPQETPGMSWDEIREVIQIQEKGIQIPPIDSEKAPPYPFCHSPIFVAVDVELKEGVGGVVTEVGISTLDTDDIVGSAPGKNGENWQRAIRSRHFRILEHLHHVNHNFVAGCPDKFEFGTSEIIAHADLHHAIAGCLRHPFSGKGAAVENPPPRNLVLVGHDIKSDIRALQAIGCHLYNFVEFFRTIDTAELYRALKHEWNPTSLGAILYEFNIIGWNLHNAGNDAMYTMRAMIAIAVAHSENRGKPEAHKEMNEKQAQKMIEAANEAMQSVVKEGEGWDTN